MVYIIYRECMINQRVGMIMKCFVRNHHQRSSWTFISTDFREEITAACEMIFESSGVVATRSSSNIRTDGGTNTERRLWSGDSCYKVWWHDTSDDDNIYLWQGGSVVSWLRCLNFTRPLLHYRLCCKDHFLQSVLLFVILDVFVAQTWNPELCRSSTRRDAFY